MRQIKTPILSLNLDELRIELQKLGLAGFRAKQVFSWLHQKNVTDFSEMTNLSKTDREKLSEVFYIDVPKVLVRQRSEKDGTQKFLLSFSDGETSEIVAMKYKHGISLCISTQIGCKMGCRFCASTLAGFVRNLTVGEMLSEVYTAQRDLKTTVDSIVLMGIGEPLDNYENVLKFLRLINVPEGRNLSLRHVSLSTCGLVDRIYDLMGEKLQLTLSVSLHAVDEKKRSELMPINKKNPLKELILACDEYAKQTGRRISYEYSLMAGVNDREEDAKALGKLLRGKLAHVNLIPVNPVKETKYKTSNEAGKFAAFLEKNGVNATVRRTLGDDIEAACGQLRRQIGEEGK